MIAPENNINLGGVVKLELVPLANAVSVREKNLSCILTVTDGFTPAVVYSTYKSNRVQNEPTRTDGGTKYPSEVRWLVPQDRLALWESILPYLNQHVLIIATLNDGNQKLYGTPDFPLLLTAKHTPYTTPDSWNGAEIICQGSDILPGRFLLNIFEYVEPEEPVDPDLQLLLRADQVELSSSRVTRVIDQTGNGFDAITNFGYAGPLVISDHLNGHPVFDFDSAYNRVGLKIVTDYFGKTSLWGGGENGISEEDSFTLFFVAKHNDTHSDILRLFGNNNLEFQFKQFSGDDCITISDKGDITTDHAYLRGHDSDFHIWAIVQSEGVCSIYLDGVLLWEPALTTETEKSGDFLINKMNWIGEATNKFMMAELRIYDSLLSTSKLASIIAELKSYYAIS